MEEHMALDDYLTKKIEAGQFERVRFFFIFVDMLSGRWS